MGNTSSGITRVNIDNYTSRPIIMRSNGLLLFAPSREQFYEIVLPLPMSDSKSSAIRICMFEQEYEAKTSFATLKEVIPEYFKITKNESDLQKVCEIMKINPLWTLMHVVIELNKPHLLHSENVIRYMDTSNHVLSPIMLAIHNKNFEIVKTLVGLGCSLTVIDDNDRTILHYAANGDTNILMFLLEKREIQNLKNTPDGNGALPIAHACINDIPDNVTLLLNIGSSLENPLGRNISILELCSGVSCLEILVDNGADVNYVNQNGVTPLHHFIIENNVDCVIYLLSQGADPNFKQKNGDYLIHTAILMSRDVDIVKALIVFGADVNCKNSLNQTPRHITTSSKRDYLKIINILHSVGAERCTKSNNCDDLCSPNGNNDGCIPIIALDSTLSEMDHLLNVIAMERAAERNHKLDGGRLLSLDGGGIRGLIIIQILLELEKFAKQPIINYFDWVSGTSTGGIIAMALSVGKSLSECRKMYFALKNKVFSGSMPHSGEKLEELLKKNFGGDMCLSSIKKPKLIITSIYCEECPLRLHLHRNYPIPKDIINNGSSAVSKQIPIWKVARATSAAPGYFDPVCAYGFMDGGLLANNPTLDALTEILEYEVACRAARCNDAKYVTMVLSCGTGVPPTTHQFTKTVSLFEKIKTSSISQKVVSVVTIATILKDIKNIVVDLITGSDGRFADRARAWCCTAGIPYYRLNPKLSADVKLDETSNAVLIHMLWETKHYLYQNRFLLKEVADCLTRE